MLSRSVRKDVVMRSSTAEESVGFSRSGDRMR